MFKHDDTTGLKSLIFSAPLFFLRIRIRLVESKKGYIRCPTKLSEVKPFGPCVGFSLITSPVMATDS